MLYEYESGLLNIALGGDFILSRRLSVFREERFLALRDVFGGADARFVNLESCVHEYLEGHHNIQEGTYPMTEPALLEDAKWLGINMVSCANSHSFDYGEEGVIVTNKYLDRSGIVHAGTGRNLREARSPAYLDTPKGRVGLLSVTAHFNEWAIAGEQRPDTPGRAGVNPLRFETQYVVGEEDMQYLRRLGAALGAEAAKERRRNQGFPVSADAPDRYGFLGNKFVIGEDFAIRTKPNDQDLQANLKQVREAKHMADWVVVSLHCHQMGGAALLTAQLRSQIEEIADFVKEFARRCIDEGADIFVCHGPQVPLGIEIYKGKPIFYSLGSFVFQLETVRYLPEEAYRRYGLSYEATPADFIQARYQGNTKGHPADPLQWEQIFAICKFDHKMLKEILLYPLDLGYGKPRSQRGRPILADEELGKKIVDRVKYLSKKQGTEVSFIEGRGVISI
jgi:poly-gamma-glutamate synthesis protein (capsule biosynthesis protein)